MATDMSLMQLAMEGKLELNPENNFHFLKDLGIDRMPRMMNMFSIGHFGENKKYEDIYKTGKEVKTNKVYEDYPIYRTVFTFTPKKVKEIYSFEFPEAKDFFKLNIFSGNNYNDVIVSFNSPVEAYQNYNLVDWAWLTNSKKIVFRIWDKALINVEHKFIFEYSKSR